MWGVVCVCVCVSVCVWVGAWVRGCVCDVSCDVAVARVRSNASARLNWSILVMGTSTGTYGWMCGGTRKRRELYLGR